MLCKHRRKLHLLSKHLPKVVDELRNQNKHLMMLNENLVSPLKDKKKQFNNLLEICEKTKCLDKHSEKVFHFCW